MTQTNDTKLSHPYAQSLSAGRHGSQPALGTRPGSLILLKFGHVFI